MQNDEPRATIQSIFTEIFGNNVIGDPSGEPSYAYVRVSSSGQAEEGRSGLPRQLINIHERARELKLKIPFELVFCDDHTGFEFRERPGLQALLAETTRSERRAHHLTIEYLDRLSRNARWHQGFLLDLFAEHKMAVHFWKSFGSEIERVVMGAISEQGMRHEIERMVRGTRHKAESQRITAKTRAYGYMFADSDGRPQTDSASKYRKDTHYILHPDEAPIMREIYEHVIRGDSLYTICNDFNTRGLSTPKGARYWTTSNVSKLLKNPLYKGQYAANRYYYVKEWSESAQRMIRRQHIRPKEEWIIVPVPAVVSAEVWQDAQDALKRNLKLSTRNAKRSFLLQGFLQCARCGETFYTSSSGGPRDELKRCFYGCSSRFLQPVLRERFSCQSPFVLREVIDVVVWEAVCRVITEPDMIIQYLEEQTEAVVRGGLNDQLAYIEREIRKCEREEHQWDRAFAGEIFSLAEYKDKKAAVLARKEALLVEREQLLSELQDAQEFETKKDLIRQHLLAIQKSGFAETIPLKDKRRILALLLDHVVVDTHEGWFRLEGVIEGTYRLDGIYSEETTTVDAQFTYMSAL